MEIVLTVLCVLPTCEADLTSQITLLYVSASGLTETALKSVSCACTYVCVPTVADRMQQKRPGLVLSSATRWQQPPHTHTRMVYLNSPNYAPEISSNTLASPSKLQKTLRWGCSHNGRAAYTKNPERWLLWYIINKFQFRQVLYLFLWNIKHILLMFCINFT